MALILRSYRIHEIQGDKYAGSWVADAFRSCGIDYRYAEKTASEAFLELLPQINQGAIELLDDKRQTSQLIALERRKGRTGKDTLSHPPGGHDDRPNALAHAAIAASEPKQTWGFISLKGEEPDGGFRPDPFVPLGQGPPRRQAWKPWDAGGPNWRRR